MRRICTTTGLAVLETPLRGFRIAKSSYGPTSPLQRPALAADSPARNNWSRFDTPGSTIYLADTRRTAYLETLTPIRIGSQFRSAVAYMATIFGVSSAQARQMVETDWAHNGNMVPGWLPAIWREGRLMYQLEVPAPAQWIDLTAAESLATLNKEIGSLLEALGESETTLGTLTGNNRLATTAIAEWIRQQTLDDGTNPDGIKFHSKYGGGTCHAYWLRRHDLGLAGDGVRRISEQEIQADDAELTSVLKMYGAQCR